MRLEVRRSRSLRSSNLFPLASYIPSDQEPGRTASELRTALFRFSKDGSMLLDEVRGTVLPALSALARP
ncbi:hypothetical protein V511_13975 [Mesotoga sp. Brook.08.YT.4.2.5.1]|nr:hypothetical protein V511_13975 [Mesotoga sp. Brook.08.YT.4.2.5.1]